MKRTSPRQFDEEAAGFERGAASRMREVQASEAKTHLAQLLDDVERGETIIITRHGRAIARLVPDPERRQREIAEAIADIKSLGAEIRRKHGPISIEEIISSIHEGHNI